MTLLDLGNDAWLRWARPEALAGLETGHEAGAEATALALLSAEERARLDATVSAAARERLLWGRMLLRQLVGDLAGIEPSAVELEARCIDCGGSHGRPIVVGGNARARALTLSVSACAGMVVVGAAAGRTIGVDVEPRAGSEDRLRAVRQLTGHTIDPLRHWTRVEAVLKADGRGLRLAPSTVAVHNGDAELDGTRYRLVDAPVAAEFVTSVALGPTPGTAEARH